jgi:hypothetical protein
VTSFLLTLITSTQSRIFVVGCGREQKTNTSGKVHQMRGAGLQRRAINQPCGRTTNGKIRMALIGSTLDETDWKDVLRGVAFEPSF